jgi:hypothetical protein
LKQAGNISFVGIYGSGHEVPFYQPPAALSIFERAINGKGVAAGALTASRGYLTEGAKDSTYRTNNSTIQPFVLSANASTTIRQVRRIRHIGRRSWSEEGAGPSEQEVQRLRMRIDGEYEGNFYALIIKERFTPKQMCL